MSKPPDRSRFKSRGPEAHKPLAGSEGVPASELTEIVVGPCVRCGKIPGRNSTGSLSNVHVVKGVIHGDALCSQCMTEGETSDHQEALGRENKHE